MAVKRSSTYGVKLPVMDETHVTASGGLPQFGANSVLTDVVSFLTRGVRAGNREPAYAPPGAAGVELRPGGATG